MKYPEDWSNLPKRERRQKMKELKRQEVNRQALIAKVRNWIIGLAIVVAVTAGGYFWWVNREVLPPTDFAGHTETSPQSHILDKPMALTTQKHMLEHADGSGPPGVIINYNCEDFECEEGLKEKLAEIANQYPEFVYVAPYPAMTKMLAITRYREIETFDSFNQDALIAFIEKGLKK